MVENGEWDMVEVALWCVPGSVSSNRLRSGTADIQLARERMAAEWRRGVMLITTINCQIG